MTARPTPVVLHLLAGFVILKLEEQTLGGLVEAAVVVAAVYHAGEHWQGCHGMCFCCTQISGPGAGEVEGVLTEPDGFLVAVVRHRQILKGEFYPDKKADAVAHSRRALGRVDVAEGERAVVADSAARVVGADLCDGAGSEALMFP